MKIAIYARVSTTRQAENDLSIPDQLRQIREWARANSHIVAMEYVEPGATATDDKRPQFQRLIQDALQKPAPYDAIVVHSLSRFFRDPIQMGFYERKLKKNKVKLISITQQTSDDSQGEMMRLIISTFDEYQSKENGKHTSRAMKENARQGYHNGSKPPYGYEAVSTDVQGSHGRKKKKLAINELEADVVKLIYQLYLTGDQGKNMGVKQIAVYLNSSGILMRGAYWRSQKVQSVISDSLYMGELYFNVYDSKAGEKRPPSEWIKTEIPPIVDSLQFEQVRLKRESRIPAKSNPRAISSPCLLTGLLKCGHCGNSLTLATGKGGKYRYYKCTNRKNKGNVTCNGKNLPMDKVDKIILNQLADNAFRPERIQKLMSEFRKTQQVRQNDTQEQQNVIQRQLLQLDERQHRLLNAIELGYAELDEVTQKRMQQIKTARDALQIEKANLRNHAQVKFEPLRSSQIIKLSEILKSKLLNDDQGIARSYLHLLVDKVKVVNEEAIISGNMHSLIAASELATNKNGLLKQVPTSVPKWGG